MHALARQRLEAGGGHRGERLALAGLHLDQMTAGERDASEHLDVIRPQPDRAIRGLANEREDLHQQLLQGILTICSGDGTRADVSGPGPQVVITLGSELGPLRRDCAGELQKGLEVDLGRLAPPAAQRSPPSISPTGLRGSFLRGSFHRAASCDVASGPDSANAGRLET